MKGTIKILVFFLFLLFILNSNNVEEVQRDLSKEYNKDLNIKEVKRKYKKLGFNWGSNSPQNKR